MKKTFLITILVLAFVQCKNTNKASAEERTVEQTLEENSEKESSEKSSSIETKANSIVGQTYRGILPCADCMGIETELRFKTDGNYEVKSFYLGKSGKVNYKEGQYQINSEQLICRINNQIVSRFKIKGNQLIPVGSQGGDQGELTALYILRKNISDLTDRMWELYEVLGERVKESESGRMPYLLVENKGNFSASGGCNSMFGTYSLSGKNFIQFGEIASTEMACVFEHFDRQLIEALERCGQFNINQNNEMSLIIGKAAPLARFKKVGI